MFPVTQGYYVYTSDRWRPALTVPCDHLPTWQPNASLLMRDMCHIDAAGRPAVAYAGLLMDGVSCWAQNYGRYLLPGTIHDSECAIIRSLPPGPERRTAQAHADQRFRAAILAIGMSPARAAVWWAAVASYSLATRSVRWPSYLTDLEGYYRARGLPERYIEAGLRLAADNRRAM
jgi:hypothetical protein